MWLCIASFICLLYLVPLVPGLQRETDSTHLLDLEVSVNEGRISGLAENDDGRIFYSYRNIPYAQPPVGGLRFKDPVPAQEWDGVRDGRKHSQPCLQPSYKLWLLDIEEIIGSEDCLYLNVFTPYKESENSENKDGMGVMVYFHGGSYGQAFVSGDIKDYNPAPLVTFNVIVVTVQYRLGLLGFASTEDEVLPGNLGLKDQTLALRWIKKNIHIFGGDPSKVTVFGEGAGAMSIHLLMFSPMASGLFHRAILQSGSALSPLALHKHHKEYTIQLSRLWNCSAEDSTQLYQCLNNASDIDITLAPHRMAMWHSFPNIIAPRVDGTFLPVHPAIQLKDGTLPRVEIMTGLNSHEGAPTSLGLVSHRKTDYAILKFNFSNVAPLSLLLRDEDDSMFLTHRAYLHYLSLTDMMGGDGEDILDQLTQLYGDRWVRSGVEDTAHLHSVSGRIVYLYQLHYRGHYSCANFVDTLRGQKYVCHGDEVFYFFNEVLTNQPMTRHEDSHVRQIMTRLWTNFAKTGDPTINGSLGFRWSPIGSHNGTKLPTLQITTSPEMTYTDKKRTDFWRNLPTKTNKILFPERFL